MARITDIEKAEDGFFVHALYLDGDGDPDFTPGYEAYIYLGVTVVFKYSATEHQFPAGIEDFAGTAFRTFAERLRDVLK